jgi:flagellar basal-body rod protein FlgB
LPFAADIPYPPILFAQIIIRIITNTYYLFKNQFGMVLAIYTIENRRDGMSDSLFGLSEKALQLSEQRAVMLSNNIVNSATPNYKARDIDFHKVLQETTDNQASILKTTDAKHIQTGGAGSAPVLYRIPMKENLDGNTVDGEIERKNFLQNALNYQVNLTFVKNSSDKLMKAFKGE